MLTVGSVDRPTAARWLDFLAEDFRGRRKAIRRLTHGFPEFVFWIYPDGGLHDAVDSHKAHPPPGFLHIIHDEPDYGGFLRGRVVRHAGKQLIVVYCREDALAVPSPALIQFLDGMDQVPVPIDRDALVISDNADIYGTIEDLWQRQAGEETSRPLQT